ncbi:MAG: patatin-like phospholipase family protein, partial [Halioglobus sp.]
MTTESHKSTSQRRWRAIHLLAAFLVSSCTSIYEPDNKAITFVDETSGYRRLAVMKSRTPGDTMLLLAFSGGGTRAAALSYGVMQELRDTEVDGRAGRMRLLDEVDAISSVSGGSFTAAYFGVYREQLFEDYEDVFLRQGVQQALIRKLLSPGHWMRSGFSGFDRTEMAVDYYDRTIFKGATFADMARRGPPFIDINATDLATGMRFTFTQELFDLICTDLNSFSVARAVTASSAVPVAFPTVVLKNHADQCDVDNTDEWRFLEGAQPTSRSQEALIEGMKSYRDFEHRKYIHLVDGGIADNLGLRTLIGRFEFLGEEGIGMVAEHGVKNLLLILVNAEVNPERLIEKTANKPSAGATMS